MFKKLSSKSIYQDQWLEFFQDEIEFPDGSTGTYAYAKRKDGVLVAVVTSDKRILLHKEYRYPINGYSWELPGGGIDENETLERAAARELKEEAGISVDQDSLTKIGAFYPLNSFNAEFVTVFIVTIEPTELTTGGNESSESIHDQRYVTFKKALDMIDSGQVNDAMTANIIQLVIRKVNG